MLGWCITYWIWLLIHIYIYIYVYTSTFSGFAFTKAVLSVLAVMFQSSRGCFKGSLAYHKTYAYHRIQYHQSASKLSRFHVSVISCRMKLMPSWCHLGWPWMTCIPDCHPHWSLPNPTWVWGLITSSAIVMLIPLYCCPLGAIQRNWVLCLTAAVFFCKHGFRWPFLTPSPCHHIPSHAIHVNSPRRSRCRRSRPPWGPSFMEKVVAQDASARRCCCGWTKRPWTRCSWVNHVVKIGICNDAGRMATMRRWRLKMETHAMDRISDTSDSSWRCSMRRFFDKDTSDIWAWWIGMDIALTSRYISMLRSAMEKIKPSSMKYHCHPLSWIIPGSLDDPGQGWSTCASGWRWVDQKVDKKSILASVHKTVLEN